MNAWEAPRVDRPLKLICGACGASGEYDVGTVTIGPDIGRDPDGETFERAVGFTGYFRCRECDAGGPWELPIETLAYLTLALAEAAADPENAPIIFGSGATFDGHIIRYATDGEAHLKELIDREPERGFLWVRLGNLYSHTDLQERAEAAYKRAVELDPEDIEAHGMLGQSLAERGRSMEAVPHWHAVLKHARNARQVKKELRRGLVRAAIESLLEAHAESKGQIDLLPEMTPELLKERPDGEPIVLELREIDLGGEEGVDELCDMFLGRPRRHLRDLFRRRGGRVLATSDNWPTEPLSHAAPAVGRNEPCPCGSGQKYKKCCGR